MRFTEAFLHEPPRLIVMGWGQLGPERSEWTQPFDRWAAFLYRHTGILKMNNTAVPFQPSDLVLIPPGTRCSHNLVEEGTQVLYATFDLPDKSRSRVALPLLNKATPELEAEFESTAKQVGSTLPKSRSFVWHLLWTLAQPTSVMRDRSEMYEAETWIQANLDRKITVVELAQHLDVPQRTLLQWFKVAHGTTVKQYINDRRSREACRLLSESELSVKVIAAKVGMTDLQQFSKLIKGSVGLSPRQYRHLSQ